MYLFDTQLAGFSGCFLIKKELGGAGGSLKLGTWDSIHFVVVDLERQAEGKARYKLTSNVFLKMISSNPATFGSLEIAGNVSRSREETYAIDPRHYGDEFHIGNIGRLIEANETEIRTEMDTIYINKTKQIMNTGRLKEEYMTRDEKLNFQAELAAAVSGLKKL